MTYFVRNSEFYVFHSARFYLVLPICPHQLRVVCCHRSFLFIVGGAILSIFSLLVICSAGDFGVRFVVLFIGIISYVACRTNNEYDCKIYIDRH